MKSGLTFKIKTFEVFGEKCAHPQHGSDDQDDHRGNRLATAIVEFSDKTTMKVCACCLSVVRAQYTEETESVNV